MLITIVIFHIHGHNSHYYDFCFPLTHKTNGGFGWLFQWELRFRVEGTLRLTEGVVKDSRRIKVRLETGEVGRVKTIGE